MAYLLNVESKIKEYNKYQKKSPEAINDDEKAKNFLSLRWNMSR